MRATCRKVEWDDREVTSAFGNIGSHGALVMIGPRGLLGMEHGLKYDKDRPADETVRTHLWRTLVEGKLLGSGNVWGTVHLEKKQ